MVDDETWLTLDSLAQQASSLFCDSFTARMPTCLANPLMSCRKESFEPPDTTSQKCVKNAWHIKRLGNSSPHFCARELSWCVDGGPLSFPSKGHIRPGALGLARIWPHPVPLVPARSLLSRSNGSVPTMWSLSLHQAYSHCASTCIVLSIPT